MPNLNLKNFAKIKNSDFDIKDITLFVGKPSSGKSYVMKTLYAIDEAFRLSIDNYRDLTLELLEDDLLVEKLLNDINVNSINKDQIQAITSTFKNQLLELQKNQIDFIPENNRIDSIFNTILLNILKAIFSNLDEISKDFSITYNTVNIEYINNHLSTNIDVDNEHLVKNAVFVETPLILEFKHFMTREEGKTPYHIESLLKILDKDYSFTDEAQNEFIEIFIEKSKAIISGNIENSGDSFIFKTADTNFSITNTSSGIKSIGLLQYLVTNKALKKGSTLYWEEPEVHLHPTWQLKMVDLFVELMNAGVKVVFSTHSPFMADYLNAKATKENFKEKISFNLLSEEDSTVSNTILDDNSWHLLQSELLDPLEEIMWEYL